MKIGLNKQTGLVVLKLTGALINAGAGILEAHFEAIELDRKITKQVEAAIKRLSNEKSS